MNESEEKLKEGCRLIKRETHELFRRPEDGKLFVRDTDLTFDFGTPNALTQALDTAEEANDSETGCAECPLYPQCLPTPCVLAEDTTLVPAQLTSLD
ncbi:MAG: hypothetical protein AAB768_01425 [Patescibacteria group bacterium]